mmetsp:Transcript_10685/g.27008  ORF Transcript_10685/g.27008 Transcript_10685/m.27008 type:complete len:88 (-) Transcript_10685:407-670(-)
MSKAEAISRRMFIVGCFLLPGVWLLSYLFFRPHFDTHPETKPYVYRGLVGFSVFAVALLCWILWFQLSGTFSTSAFDWLLVLVPKGH